MLLNGIVFFQLVFNHAHPFLNIISEAYMHMSHRAVSTFIHIYEAVKKRIYALTRAEYCGNYRHTNHIAQGVGIEFCSCGKKLVIHVERNDHTAVHIDKLGRKIEISFKI